MVGIRMLPGGQLWTDFSLSFVFYYYILNDLRFGTNACAQTFRRACTRQLLAGKSHGILSGLFTPAFLTISLFISPTILFMIVFPLRGNHDPFSGWKRDREASVLSWLYFCHGGNRYGERQSTTSSLRCHGALQNATGIAISTRNIWWLAFQRITLYRDVGCS